MTLQLSSLAPFAQGGNRLCFVHPHFNDQCIKVRRPDRPLEQLRASKGFPKNLRPLSSFDDNLEEYEVMGQLEKQFGPPVFDLISRCMGFTESDMGRGLVSELIRDGSGPISHTLKQHLWDHGYTKECQQALDRFAAKWVTLGVSSRDLLLHNIVVQLDQQGRILRLVVIDGLGNPNMLPMSLLPARFRRWKAKRKIDNLQQRIETLIAQRGSDTFPGYHGQLFHNGMPPSSKESCDEN